MAGRGTAVMTPPVAPSTNPIVARFRREAGTTPGRIRLLSVLVVGVLLLTGVASYGVLVRRTAAVSTVANAEPLIVDAQALDTSLSQADATAANAFLGGGIEPADERVLYQHDIDEAARLLADAAERSGPAASVQAPLRTLASEVAVYTGLVDTARANNRQGFPVGAAYLRQASALMVGTILPAAQQLYAAHASRLKQGNSRARSVHDTAVIVFMLALLLLAMVLGQVWLFSRTNRLLNPPVVAATLIAAVLLIVVGIDLRGEAGQTAQARDRAFARVDLLSQARIVAFKAKGDESLTLIGRGNGGAFNTDFDTQVAKVPALFDRAHRLALTPEERNTNERAALAFQNYLTVHRTIRGLDDGGQFDRAVSLTVAGGTTSVANQAFNAFDTQVEASLNLSQADFVTHINRAHQRLHYLAGAIAVVLVLGAMLALYGLQQRINEYR